MKLLAHIRLPLLGLLLMFMSGCALHGTGLHGTVDIGGGSPSDVFVIVKWNGEVPVPPTATACLHASITKTNSEGHFEVPGWWTLISWWNLFPVFDRSSTVYVFKPGFELNILPEFQNGDRISLKKAVYTPEQQLDLLAGYGAFCHYGDADAEDPQHVMREFYLALDEGVHQLGIQTINSEMIAARIKNQLDPEQHDEQPLRVQLYRQPPAPVGQAAIAPAPLQSRTPAPTSSTQQSAK